MLLTGRTTTPVQGSNTRLAADAAAFALGCSVPENVRDVKVGLYLHFSTTWYSDGLLAD